MNVNGMNVNGMNVNGMNAVEICRYFIEIIDRVICQ